MDDLLENYVPLDVIAWAKYNKQQEECDTKNENRKPGDKIHLPCNKQLMKLLDIKFKARKDILKRIFDLEYKLGLVAPELAEREQLLRKAYIEKCKKAKQKINKDKIKNVRHVTLSFDDEKVKPILKELPKILKTNLERLSKATGFIKDYKFCIEQRTDIPGNEVSGIHSHILMTTTDNIHRGYIVSSLYKFCKEFMKGDNFIHINNVKTKSHAANCSKYLEGIKVPNAENLEKRKQEKVNRDKIMRMKHQIKEFYQKRT